MGLPNGASCEAVMLKSGFKLGSEEEKEAQELQRQPRKTSVVEAEHFHTAKMRDKDEEGEAIAHRLDA